MGVVFGVAIVFIGEEGSPESVVAGCGVCEEIAEIGRHVGGVGRIKWQCDRDAIQARVCLRGVYDTEGLRFVN